MTDQTTLYDGWMYASNDHCVQPVTAAKKGPACCILLNGKSQILPNTDWAVIRPLD